MSICAILYWSKPEPLLECAVLLVDKKSVYFQRKIVTSSRCSLVSLLDTAWLPYAASIGYYTTDSVAVI